MRLRVKTLFRVMEDFKEFDYSLKRATSGAMRECSEGMKRDLRSDVERAGLGRRVANTWRNAVYPDKGKVSANAAASVYSRAPHIIAAYDQATTIRSRNGQWLAIPTDNVPPGSRNRRLTPANWPDNLGKLRFVKLPNGKAMLVAEGVRYNKNGKLRGLRRRKASKTRGEHILISERVSVPMFILIRQASIRKRLDVKGVADKWGARINPTIDRLLMTKRIS